MTRPFLPSDIVKADPLRNWRRYAAVAAVAHARGSRDIDEVAKSLYGNDGDFVMRAAVTPTTQANAAALGETHVGAFLSALGPQSAGAPLLARALTVSLGRAASISLPQLSTDVTAVIYFT